MTLYIKHHKREEKPAANSGLAKGRFDAPQETFVVNQSFVLRINICGKIATFAKPQNVKPNIPKTQLCSFK